MGTLNTIIDKRLEDFRKIRTEAISEMFDNVDEIGIYPTSKFFGKIDNALKQAITSSVKEAFRECRMGKEYTSALNYEVSTPDGDKPRPEEIAKLGYNQAIAQRKQKEREFLKEIKGR